MLSVPEGYSPVQLKTLCPETVMGFNLYLITDSTAKPTLYCSHDAPLTIEQREKLEVNNIKTMYIASGDSGAYQEYLEENIVAVLDAPGVPTKHKTELMYGCAQNMLEGVFTSPDTSDVLKRSQLMVTAVSEFVFREADAFTCFLETSSFDYAVYSHSVNVFMYSISLAQRVGYTDKEWLNRLGTGAMLHDIGKSLIDPALLHHKGALSREQWDVMRMHPVWGWEILVEQGVKDEMVLNITRSHHEKLTGSGYPDNLSGEKVPVYVRIVTICDIFDALSTNRSYKEAKDTFTALKFMSENIGDEIDAKLFREFVKMMSGI